MAKSNSKIAALLGEIEEYSGGGSRVVLPESHYIGTIEVDETNVTDILTREDDEGNDRSDEALYVINNEGKENEEFFVDANNEKVARGGSPFVSMVFTVDEGPFTGCSFQGRFWLTPGKGPNVGFVQNAAKVVSGKGVNTKVLDEYGFEFPEDIEQAEAQQYFRRYFYALDADERLAFMVKYCNIGQWDGKSCVVKVGQEPGRERKNETTGRMETPVFNRFQGFRALAATTKGAGWVRSVCHRKQEAAAVEMGLVEVDG